VPEDDASETDPLDLAPPGDFELFVVDGKAYTRIGMQTPATPDDAYLNLLANTLSGPDGPGLWLNLLPDESFMPQGPESYGGFTAAKFLVDGQATDWRLTGTIWVDEGSSALVGATLSIPGGLFYPPESGLAGEVSISLRVEPASIPPISIP
jgi:hypothetical protein